MDSNNINIKEFIKKCRLIQMPAKVQAAAEPNHLKQTLNINQKKKIKEEESE